MARQGPRAGARGGGREVEDWRMLSVRRGLHCCMVAPSADVLEQEAEEIFWGGLVQKLRGEVVASCRTKAGAGFALALGDAARPERRVGGPGLLLGCAGRRGRRGEPRKKEETKKQKQKWMQVRGSLMGTPRAVVGAAGAVVVGTLSGSQ